MSYITLNPYPLLTTHIKIADWKNLEPILRDLRQFSDKVARNPELLGVGGAVRPSNGLKDEEMLNSKRSAVPPNARGKSPN